MINSETLEKAFREYIKGCVLSRRPINKTDFIIGGSAAECVKKYIELNPTKTAEDVLNDWRGLGNIVPHFIESKEQYDARTDNSKRSHEIACGGVVIYVAHNGYGNNGKVLVLTEAVNQKNWGITIQKMFRSNHIGI